ncbi:MAG: methylglyoxal synthase [Nitriliruptoraceae bacterium]
MNEHLPRRTIALVAHDLRKADLLAWAQQHRGALASHRLVATGTTGQLLADELGLEVLRLESGPLGGDMQLGAMLSRQEVDLLVFLWDPLSAQPHEPDVRALLRIATLWNVPVATNQATAELLITSSLLTSASYVRQVPDHAAHRERLRSAD